MTGPTLSQGRPNDEIDLGTYSVAVRSPTIGLETGAPADWSLLQTFTPGPRLRLSSALSVPVDKAIRAAFLDKDDDHSLVVFERNPVPLSLEEAFKGQVAFEALRTPCQIFPPSSTLKSAAFRLFNWPAFRPLGGLSTNVVASFVVGQWVIDLSKVPDIGERLNLLRRVGGYVITHEATVRRADDSTFSSQDLDHLVDGLHHFFSFALGKWAGPQLVTATNSTGGLDYFRAGIGKLSDGAYSLGHSWVDADHTEILCEALPGFLGLLSNPVWHDALIGVIYFYVNANSLGRGVNVDTSALFTQAALELLSWTYCIHDRKLVLEDLFRKSSFTAADQIRLLGTSLGIPLEVPSELTGLTKGLLKQNEPRDLASVLTRLRQLVTHPAKKESLNTETYMHGWMAAQWLIELIVLRLAGYNGKYAKRYARRHVGSVELVPWAIAAS